MNNYNYNNQKPYKMARSDSTNNNVRNGSSATTEVPSSMSPSTDWGDDNEDEMLFEATQAAEKHEGVIGRTNKQSPVLGNNQNKGFPRMNSDEANTESLALRRQRLGMNSNHEMQFPDTTSGPSGDEMKMALDKVKALEQQLSSFQTEIHRLKGETSILRNTNASLKQEQQEEVKKRVAQTNETNDKLKALDKIHQEEIKRLKYEQMELKKLNAKARLSRKSSSPANASQTSILSSNQTTYDDSSSFDNQTNDRLSEVSHILSQSLVLPSSSITSIPAPAIIPYVEPKPELSTKEVQTEPIPSPPRKEIPIQVQGINSSSSSSDDEIEIIDFEADTIKVRLEDEDLMENPAQAREDILGRIKEIVELRFQLILPTLEAVVKAAPKEIMKRLVRRVERTSAFPDVVDTMFQWGVERERRKKTEAIEPEPPILPCKLEPGVYYHKIRVGIETRFRFEGTWGALLEVRELIQNILKSLEGDKKFRIYEHNTLVNFWRLLYWAKELWRCILFEEEDEELVERNKQRWTKELESWTSIVLKCDWRDYFVLELEVEVRKLTLSILECIIMAGYFEQTVNRYEILYRVIKDVLINDVFRTPRNVQHVLKIITWSMSDVMILKHMCYKKNDGNCLARLIGDSVLKLCKYEKDPMIVAILYLDYLNMLETMTLEKPRKYHQSKFARSLNNEEENANVRPKQQRDPEPMELQFNRDDDEFISTQLACPIKFKIQPEQMNIEMDTLEEELNGWLHPSKYEDPYGKHPELCQCRKVLFGTCIFLLKMVLNSWKECCKKYENDIEALKCLDCEEVDQIEKLLKSAPIVTKEDKENKAKLNARLKYLRDKKSSLVRFLPKARKKLSNISEDVEWNCKDIVDSCGRGIYAMPSWMLELGRQGNIFDLVISKGILMMSYLQTSSGNLAAAVGSEAYRTYYVLIPRLRLHMEELVLNTVDRTVLISVTPECEEESVNIETTSIQSQCQLQNRTLTTTGNEPEPRDLTFRLKTLNENNIEPASRDDSEGELKALRSSSTRTSDEDVAALYDALCESFVDEFVMNSTVRK